MKRHAVQLATLLAAVLLAGCASSGSARMQYGIASYQVDRQYVARVEAVARARGVDVEWVHPPRRIDRE
jgi:hypothetical protein